MYQEDKIKKFYDSFDISLIREYCYINEYSNKIIYINSWSSYKDSFYFGIRRNLKKEFET